MEKKNPDQQGKAAPEASRRPTISTQRWTSLTTHPRLVSFSWGVVRPMGSQR